MIRINSFFLRQRFYHFRKNWSSISFPFPFKNSYVFPRPFETPKNGQIPFLFLGTHTRFVTTKRIMVTPPLTTSFMIYKFHSNRNTLVLFYKIHARLTLMERSRRGSTGYHGINSVEPRRMEGLDSGTLRLLIYPF